MKKIKTNFSIVSTIFILIFLFAFAVNAQTDKIDSEKVKKKSEKQLKDKPLKIKSKTPLSPGAIGECFRDSRATNLFVRLKVTFHSSGKVTDAEISESSGCKFFDKESLRVAKKIKFKPEIKNGESITVVKPIEYSFFTVEDR